MERRDSLWPYTSICCCCKTIKHFRGISYPLTKLYILPEQTFGNKLQCTIRMIWNCCFKVKKLTYSCFKSPKISCRPHQVPQRHAAVLSQSRRNHRYVWHHAWGVIHGCPPLVGSSAGQSNLIKYSVYLLQEEMSSVFQGERKITVWTL